MRGHALMVSWFMMVRDSIGGQCWWPSSLVKSCKSERCSRFTGDLRILGCSGLDRCKCSTRGPATTAWGSALVPGTTELSEFRDEPSLPCPEPVPTLGHSWTSAGRLSLESGIPKWSFSPPSNWYYQAVLNKHANCGEQITSSIAFCGQRTFEGSRQKQVWDTASGFYSWQT